MEASGSAPAPALRSRRSLLGGGLAALSALAALFGASREAAAANGDAVKAGQITTASQPTTVRAASGNTALVGEAQGSVVNGVFGQTASTSGRGVLGIATATAGTTFGVLGESRSPVGRGLRGLASATTGANIGVSGQTASGSGFGVQGVAPPPNGVGVAGSGPIGVRGVSAAGAGRGVVGHATATTGRAFGVLGITASEDGVGVRGEARNTSGGFVPGVEGMSEASNGIGVQGSAYGAAGIGVLARGDFGLDAEGIQVGARIRGATQVNPDAIALEVTGRTVFSNSGFAAIPAGFGGVVVSPSIPLRSSSLILAMLQGDPGVPGVAVSHVRWELQNRSQFTIVLTGNVAAETPVAWFVIEPVSGS